MAERDLETRITPCARNEETGGISEPLSQRAGSRNWTKVSRRSISSCPRISVITSFAQSGKKRKMGRRGPRQHHDFRRWKPGENRPFSTGLYLRNPRKRVCLHLCGATQRVALFEVETQAEFFTALLADRPEWATRLHSPVALKSATPEGKKRMEMNWSKKQFLLAFCHYLDRFAGGVGFPMMSAKGSRGDGTRYTRAARNSRGCNQRAFPARDLEKMAELKKRSCGDHRVKKNLFAPNVRSKPATPAQFQDNSKRLSHGESCRPSGHMNFPRKSIELPNTNRTPQPEGPRPSASAGC